MSDGVELIGLDGSNPLAFLAALGTLRTLTLAWPERDIKMSWAQVEGAWRPVLHTSPPEDKNEIIVEILNNQLKEMNGHPVFQLGDNLNLSPKLFREQVLKAQSNFFDTHNRTWCDFVVTFGCEIIHKDDVIKDTAFRTMRGAGHQHFIKFMRNIIESTDDEHIRKTLFESWKYNDPVRNLTLRFDPKDDSRYALQWENPSNDKTRNKIGSMLGANRLAIEGLPFFPTMPEKNELRTTGFKGKSARDTFVTWPIWDYPINSTTVRSLISYETIQDDALSRNDLKKRGISEIFRSQRLTIGKVRNFTTAQSL